jgi:tetratricopeptide (TPR) repeat protein
MGDRSREHPERIGPYPVLRPLGEGGMARVYAVKDPVTGRHRAVKLLTQRGMAWTRFGREYRALARLHHPNIVTVYRYGVDEHQQAYLVMELVDGIPVQRWVAGFGEPGDPRRTAAVVHALTGLARALGYLHSRGFIHRDLKSNNVLVQADGTAKLLDFGATRSLGPDDSNITRLGEFVGTFTYASPEQIEGGSQDARSDIYSLGVLAYRLLCGRPPFDADSVAAISRQHFEATPEPLHQRVPGLPEGLSELVSAMLAKRPEVRPQSGAEVAEALAWLAESDLEAPTLGAVPEEVAPRLVGRRAVMKSLAATVERARPGRMVLLLGGPGSGRDRMLHEAELLFSASGFESWHAEPRDDTFDVQGAVDGLDLDGLLAELDGGGRPALLLLRNLDRASEAGVRALQAFRATVVERALPVLVVASLLEQADRGGLQLAFLDAARTPLRPLTLGEVEDLVCGMLGEGCMARGTVRRLFLETGAEPGFVVQVLQAMIERGRLVPERGPAGFRRWIDRSRGRLVVPPSVRQALTRQLEALPPEAAQVLSAVALAGEAAFPSVIARALSQDEAELARLCERLQRQHILAPSGPDEPLALLVKLGELALLGALDRGERERLTERLARALPAPRAAFGAVALSVRAGLHDQAQEELARCYLASRTGHELAQHIRLVGAVVERANRRLLGQPGRMLRLELCWARTVAAVDMDDPRVDEALQRAGELMIGQDAGAELALEHARILGLRGEGPAQDEALQRAQDSLDRDGDPRLQLQVLLARSGHALRSGALDVAAQRAVNALVVATRARDLHGQSRARVAHAVVLAGQGQLAQAEGQLAAAERGLEQAAGRDRWMANLERARLLRLQGRLSEALDLLEAPLQRARERGDAPRILAMVPAMVQLELDLFRLGEARELLVELRDMGLDDRHPVVAASLALARGRLQVASGDAEEAVEPLSNATDAADDAGLTVVARQLQACLGEALALAGDPERGARAGDQAVEGLTRIGHRPALVEACACRLRGQKGRREPAACFGPVLPWLDEQPLRLHRVEYLLATAEHAAARGESRAAHWAYQDVKRLLDEIAGVLSPELRDAFRVHPWFRRLRRAEDLGSAWRGRR